MTELEKLKQQRKEIDQRIKELTGECIYSSAGDAKFFQDYSSGSNSYNYVVHVLIPEKRRLNNYKESYRYAPITRADTKEEAIERLGKIGWSLCELYNKLKAIEENK